MDVENLEKIRNGSQIYAEKHILRVFRSVPWCSVGFRFRFQGFRGLVTPDLHYTTLSQRFLNLMNLRQGRITVTTRGPNSVLVDYITNSYK